MRQATLGKRRQMGRTYDKSTFVIVGPVAPSKETWVSIAGRYRGNMIFFGRIDWHRDTDGGVQFGCVARTP